MRLLLVALLLVHGCATAAIRPKVEVVSNEFRYVLVFAAENGQREARISGVSIQIGDARCVTDDLGACLLRLRVGTHAGLIEAEGYRSYYVSEWTIHTDAMTTIPLILRNQP